MGGVLLVGHGTRDPSGLAEFADLAGRMQRALGEAPLESCFLELAEPDIQTGLARLVERSTGAVTIVPVLLFSAGHAKHDIPRELCRLAGSYAGVDLRMSRALECDPAILELSALRYREALSAVGPDESDDTFLLLVGRGSRDTEATAEMLRFTALRRELTPVARAEACFVAMAEPNLNEGLSNALDSRCRRIVVQPHLLFDGLLRSEIAQTVSAARARHPDREWVLAAHLGTHDLVIEALKHSIAEALPFPA